MRSVIPLSVECNFESHHVLTSMQHRQKKASTPGRMVTRGGGRSLGGWRRLFRAQEYAPNRKTALS